MAINYDAIVADQQGKTADQLAATAQAATLPVAPTGVAPITPESLQPATVAPFTQPTPTPPPSSGVYDPSLFVTPPLEQTSEEKKASDLGTRLQDLNNQLVGKSDYQTKENTAFGVDTANQIITDLGAQLIGLKNEAAAIPIQIQGMGGSTRDLNTLQETKLRDNAIKALTISTLMAAAQGKLATAQAMADRAVSAKFDPIQEQITAATNNLNIILKSPEYTVADKNRAQAQLDKQNEKQATLDKQKQDYADINKLAIEAAGKGIDAATLQRIQNAKNPIEAASIYAEGVTQQNNLQLAQKNNVKTPAVNQNGTFFDAKTGKVWGTPQAFYAAMGVSSFEEAYAKGLVTDVKAPLDLSKYPASYQEYILAKQDGSFKGNYNEYQTMDANRKAVRSTTINNIGNDTKTFDLQVKQAPAQVANLKAQGKSWGDIANYLQQLGIDPGTKEIDDALHRAFQSPTDYSTWKATQ